MTCIKPVLPEVTLMETIHESHTASALIYSMRTSKCPLRHCKNPTDIVYGFVFSQFVLKVFQEKGTIPKCKSKLLLTIGS